MKVVKIFLALALIMGFPIIGISAEFFDMGHSVIFTPVCYIDAFVGVGLIFGFADYKQRPKWIGNVSPRTDPSINQNWIVFFISLIINLTVANLCG
jgi:hypothetical protein